MNDNTPSSALEAPQPDTPLTFLEAPRKQTFAEWLRVAKPGDSFVYHVGFLADIVHRPSEQEKRAGELALEAFARGEVELCQRRIKESVGNKAGAFEYIAQKRRVRQLPTIFGTEPWRMRTRPAWVRDQRS